VSLRTIGFTATLLAPLLLLTACGDDTTPSAAPTSSSPATVEPTPTDAAPAFDADGLLIVTATATADNGAVLHLTMQVHKSTNWDDPSTLERPDLMSQVCDGALENSVYEAQEWAFASISIDAVADPATPAWPSDKLIHLLPYGNADYSNATYALAPDGFVVWDEDVDPATPYCLRDMDIVGAGSGLVVLGIEGDDDKVGAAGNFTRWANTTYGFSGHEVAGQSAADAGVELTECEFAVSDLGTSLNGSADWWTELASDTNCQIGGTP
jgi:hypothetical protein